MAASRSWTCLGFFLLTISSQWLISFCDQDAQKHESVSQQAWGPWTGNGPQPIPTQKTYPDIRGGGSRGGGKSGRGGGGGGGGRRRGGGGGGEEGGGGGECICNCMCDCQNSECNNGGDGRVKGGSGGGWEGGGVGRGGGCGGGGGGASICLPLPPINCDGKNCCFGSGNFGMSNNRFNELHFGKKGGRNPNRNTEQFTEPMNATDARHH